MHLVDESAVTFAVKSILSKFIYHLLKRRVRSESPDFIGALNRFSPSKYTNQQLCIIPDLERGNEGVR